MGYDRLVGQIQVERFQAGERCAIDLLAVKFKRRLKRRGGRILHNRAGADDIVQETRELIATKLLPLVNTPAARLKGVAR